MQNKSVAVIGAGNGGFAIAADLSLAGFKVNLFELPQFKENIAMISKTGGIVITGVARTGFARVNKITSDIEQAIEMASYILVATQSLAHQEVAKMLAPIISTDQYIVIMPGSGGSFIFEKEFRERGMKIDLAETLSLPYACRKTSPVSVGVARILGAKGGRNGMGVLPSKNTEKMVKIFNEIYPNTFPMTNVLETALCNANILKHPIGALLNTGRIEYSKGQFWLYKEGMTPSVEQVIDAADNETRPIFKKLGFNASSIKQIFEKRYQKTWEEQAAAASEIAGKGPPDIQPRYITEDVPVGMVLISSLGKWLGIPTPTFDAIIHLCGIINGTDYWKVGRTVESLGISGMGLEAFKTFLREGTLEL